MTFELQVEEALAQALVVPRDGEGYSAFYRRAMDMLAPRVAAALEVAFAVGIDRGQGGVEELDEALTALRGGP